MATVVLIQPMIQRFGAWMKKQRPCRFCGEPAKPIRAGMDYTFLEKWALACENRCEPIRHTWEPQRFENLAQEVIDNLWRMADVWNEQNDSPAFIAGLA